VRPIIRAKFTRAGKTSQWSKSGGQAQATAVR